MDKYTITTGNKDTAKLHRVIRAIMLHDMWNRQYHNTVSSMFQKHKSIMAQLSRQKFNIFIMN